jgi:hypothetical protein
MYRFLSEGGYSVDIREGYPQLQRESFAAWATDLQPAS